MATATTESEDLLILPQEDTDNLVMDNEASNDDIIVQSDNEINLDDDNNDSIDNSLEIVKETDGKSSDNTLNISEDFDLGDLTMDETPETDDLTIKDDKKDDNSSSMDLGNFTSSNNDSSVGTMEDILEKAISDLNARSESIESDKKIEKDDISDLKKQEQEIQEKISTKNEKLGKLNIEQEMISKNIKSMERMKKINPVGDIASSTSKKVHNAKRKAA